MALLINTKVRGIALFRTIYYLPSIVPAVANAVLWAWILNTDFGLLNAVLYYFGIPKIAWLQETSICLARSDHDEPLGRWAGDDHLPGRIARH